MDKNRLSYQKLAIFGMTDYDKLIWMDNDIQVKKNMDRVFDDFDVKDGNQIFGQKDNYNCFNDRHAEDMSSGFMLVKPSREHMQGLIDQAKAIKNFCWGDQKIIARYFDHEERSRVNFPFSVVNWAHCGSKNSMASHNQLNGGSRTEQKK